jgi:hypothetical protein
VVEGEYVGGTRPPPWRGHEAGSPPAPGHPPPAPPPTRSTARRRRRGVRGSALRLAGYAGGVALALASAPLLIRHLGVVDFGRYTLVLSLIAMVQGLTEGGLAAVGLREYTVLDRDHRRRLMRDLLGLRFALLHEISNAAFFFLGATPLLSLIKKLPESGLRQEMKPT